MREVVGSFVGWPSDLIFPDAETPTRPTRKAGKGISRRIESVASQKEVPGRKLKKAGNDIPTTSGTKSQIMMRLEKMVEESDIMHGVIRSVDFDEGVFEFAHSEIIAKEDMQQLFEHEELGIAVIHTYICYMYVTLMRGTELCNRFNFIAASRINTTFITKNPTSVKNELVDRFMAAGDNTTPSLYLLPFNSGNGGHWVLVAMDLSRLMVYYLDSLSGDWSKYPSMKKTVDARGADGRIPVRTLDRGASSSAVAAEPIGYPGGPYDTSLLVKYEHHVARHIWFGEERGPKKELKVAGHGLKLTSRVPLALPPQMESWLQIARWISYSPTVLDSRVFSNCWKKRGELETC
ncbi:hypothetical protein KIW84_041734 [Lathyrus oleraceus]|uniref:Ubiquitin-like protease family profile domain-containing protein n=1 Tax=Pisum sativum TaxID=3888 RepID=A0A9D4XAY1_PEA|nr:hypothetical protein KIW84_041734 [Pisum sativum]